MDEPMGGVAAAAARRIGCDIETYTARVSSGMKWCSSCREWHARTAFNKDPQRGDGLASSCARSCAEAGRARYQPKARPPKGRSYVSARDGDKDQARRRVNHLVSVGMLSAPNTVPCTDCGHIHTEGERRHEYDHFLGYAAEHHEHVEAVCTTCHHAREAARGHDH